MINESNTLPSRSKTFVYTWRERFELLEHSSRGLISFMWTSECFLKRTGCRGVGTFIPYANLRGKHRESYQSAVEIVTMAKNGDEAK